MKLQSYYKIYRKKPIEEKLDLLIESVQAMERRERDYDDHPHAANRQWYWSERQGMRERTRWLRWQILEDIESLR